MARELTTVFRPKRRIKPMLSFKSYNPCGIIQSPRTQAFLLQSLHTAYGLFPIEIHSNIASAFLVLESRFLSRYCSLIPTSLVYYTPVTTSAFYLIHIP